MLRGPRRLSQAAGDEKKESNSRPTKEATRSPHRSFSQVIDDEQDEDDESPTKKRKSVGGSGTIHNAQTKELNPVAKRAFDLPSYNFVHMFDDVYDDGNDRPSKKLKVIHRRYSSSAAPRILTKQYDDSENNGTPSSPSRQSALNAAFGLRLPKSSAKQFDTTSSRK